MKSAGQADGAVDFIQIDCLWLNLFDFVCCYFCIYTLLNHIHLVQLCLLLSAERAIFFCVVLFIFPCSCTGCGLCPVSQLSAGQDTLLVQCVTQAYLTLPGPGAI